MYIRIYLQQHDVFKIYIPLLYIILIRDGMLEVFYCQTLITDASMSLKNHSTGLQQKKETPTITPKKCSPNHT